MGMPPATMPMGMPPPVGLGVGPPPMDDPPPAGGEGPRHEGLLKKRSPSAAPGKGWQERWFVLEGAVLSYFKQKDAKTMFMEVDKDGSGALDIDEIGKLCKEMGMKLSKKAEQKMMKDLDANGDNEVTFEEFEGWWQVNGGKTAKSRAAVGDITLTDMRDIQTIGTLQIALVGSDRNYNLEANSEAEAEVWVSKMRASVPSPEAAAKAGAAQRRAAWVQTMDAVVAAGGQSPPVAMAAFPVDGPLGIMWQELQHQGGAFAVVKAVQPGSAAAMNRVVAGRLLGYIQGQPTFGLSYEEIVNRIKSAARPLQIGFVAEVEPEAPSEVAAAADHGAPVLAKNWLNIEWEGGKKKAKVERRYCTLDKKRLALFKIAEDVTIDISCELVSKEKAGGVLTMDTCKLVPATAGEKRIKLDVAGGASPPPPPSPIPARASFRRTI